MEGSEDRASAYIDEYVDEEGALDKTKLKKIKTVKERTRVVEAFNGRQMKLGRTYRVCVCMCMKE
jgi:hypothetical protein